MQQYLSLFFLVLIGLVAYFNHRNPKMMSVYSSLLLLIYLVYYKTQVEMFNSSLDIFYDTIKNVRPDAENINIANLSNSKSNDGIQNIFSGMQSLFFNGNKIKTHPISSCYNKILKAVGLDNYSTYYISNNDQNMDIDYDTKRIYMSSIDSNSPVNIIKPDNKGQPYPTFIKNIPQKWIIKYVDRSIVKNGANGVPICSINIQSKSNHVEIPTYYLEYNGNKIQPSLYKGGNNQRFFIEKSLDNSGFMIKTIDNKYLARISEKYIDGNDYVGLRPTNMCDDSCVWIFKGVDKTECKKHNESALNDESCCSQYVLNKGKCILPSELNKIGRFTKYYDSPTNIFNTRIANVTKDQKNQLGKGGWLDSYNDIWNGFYSNFLITPRQYDENHAININIKTNKNTERAKGTITTSITHGSTNKTTFSVESLGSDILYGSDGKGNRIIAEMMPYDQIKNLFKIKLSDLGVENVKGVKDLMNTVLVKFLVFSKNNVINIGSSNFDNLSVKSFKMTNNNLKNNLVSVYEIINTMNKQ